MPILTKNIYKIPTNWYVEYQPVGMPTTTLDTRHDSKTKFLDAALLVIRTKGYYANSDMEANDWFNDF